MSVLQMLSKGLIVGWPGSNGVSPRNGATGGSLRSTPATPIVLFVLLLVLAPPTMAQERINLECEPRAFHVVPGEPMRLVLTVQAKSAASIRLHVPADPLLRLRAVEKLPVQRTEDGVIVHRRVVIWQALEPGTVRMKDISVETQRRKLLVPEVTITISDPSP